MLEVLVNEEPVFVSKLQDSFKQKANLL